ncbi:MAG TPA: hypothetical protein VM327_10955 [Candidatus Thermoplasmatota archaeon]|nr:hypothetical protein [Candidatus Thermoplasmatota archaeon]
MAVLPILAMSLSVFSALGFLLVGRTIQRREVSPRMRIGQHAFVVWWYALAFTTAVGALATLSPFHHLEAFLALTVLTLLILCVGLCGLLFYLVFLFTERRSLLVPMAIGYAGLFLFLLWFILAGQPTGIESTAWGPKLVYANPLDDGPLVRVAIALIVGPQVIASLGYLSLYWKVDDPLLRRRILLVSLSIFAWFGSSLVGSGADVAQSDWWRVTNRLIGLLAAGTIYYAYTGIRPNSPSSQETRDAPAETSLYESPPRRGVAHVARLAIALRV